VNQALQELVDTGGMAVQTPHGIWEAADLAERRLAGVVLNPSASEDVLLRLLADGSPAVRMVLCRDRVLPGSSAPTSPKRPERRLKYPSDHCPTGQSCT
jgi:hypothetical protein